MRGFRLLPLAVVLALASTTACRGKASREWRAEDHDEEPGTAQPAGGIAGAAAAGATNDAIIESAWKTSCAVCHGMSGAGDGPQSPMTKPPNLTDPAYLGTRTDEQLAATIRAGKGKMPAFPSLPPAIVAGLVRQVRAFGGVK